MLKSEIINKPEEILKYLHIGINLPIISEFNKYILNSFRIFNPKAIIIKQGKEENSSDIILNDVVGICLIFKQKNILFFGFFGVIKDEIKIIQLLIDNLLEYGRINDCKYIRGPLNIPAIIFGYGFSEELNPKDIEQEIDKLFIACPISPPFYLKCFLEKGFSEKYKEDFYYMPVIKLNPLKLKYDYSEYEVLFPGKHEIRQYINDALRLHIENMPEESLITPNSPEYSKIVVDFIFEFGEQWMIWFVRHKPTNHIVGTAHIVPNVFGEKDNKGRYISASFQHVVVDEKHQRKGLVLFLYGMGSLKARDKKSGNNLKYGLGIVASNNQASIAWIKKVGGVLFRRNVIVEYKYSD